MPMAIVTEAASLGCADGPAGQAAGEEPHDAPREDPHEGGDASGRAVWRGSGGGPAVGRVLAARPCAASAVVLGGHGGLEGGPGLGDASTAHLTGGFVDPPGGRGVEEGELSCHALQSTQGV